MVAITITTFNNPFSFYCLIDNNSKNVSLENNLHINDVLYTNTLKPVISNLQHGQYVAMMWNNKWVRGIVSMETQILIWLIDYGIYLRPDTKTVCLELSLEHKKLPTKVFEASIQGVTPIDKILNEFCEISNVCSKEWNMGAVDKAKELIASSKKLHFVPIACLTTEHNDIIIGDLYIQNDKAQFVNIIDELELWPVFLEKNVEAYVQNLPYYYTSRRRHRANQLKPHLPNNELPIIPINIGIEHFKQICESTAQLETAFTADASECDNRSEDGSTVIGYGGNFKKENKAFVLTPAEIEEYSNMYITVHGREYNVLNVLLNKTKDLNICERYKDHDLKSIGRGTTRRTLN